MSVKINIASYLQPFTSDTEVVKVNGSTVGGCLNHLVKQFPGIKTMLFGKNGQLHSYVGIYINREDTHPQDLTKAVKDGDELHILYIIGGG